jgi:tetratricopeptide (TPR) repeat protein
MTIPFRTPSAVAVALVMGLSIAATGCGKYSLGALKAQKAWKEANDAYRAQDWKEAAEKYEYVLQQDPTRVEAHFFLANSYDNRYKPSRAGEPDNDAMINQAVEHYRLAADKDTNPQMKKLALQYLVSAYGAEKLNDPSQAEPLVQQMIQMEPNEPTNYFALASIYEEAGQYEQAEAALLKAREIKPSDPVVHTTLATYYNRQGDFPKTMEALDRAAEIEPNNPEGFHRVATYYEEKVRKDHRLGEKEKLEYSTKGIAAEDRALQLNPNYMEAMIYKGILLRHLAAVEKDRGRQQQLLKEAVEIRDKALELQKKRGASGTN